MGFEQITFQRAKRKGKLESFRLKTACRKLAFIAYFFMPCALK